MEGAVYLTMEPDGVRIIGNDTHEILQKVPSKSILEVIIKLMAMVTVVIVIIIVTVVIKITLFIILATGE